MKKMVSEDKDLDTALNRLTKTSLALKLPEDVQIEAKALYNSCVDCLIAASIYSACKQKGVPIALSEITPYLNVSKKEVRAAHKIISNRLKLKHMPSSPSDCIPRFCTALKLNGKVLERAIEINEKAEEKGVNSGKGATTMAAASIYLAAFLEMEKITQKEVAEVAGVTELTVRNRYKELAEKLRSDLLPSLK